MAINIDINVTSVYQARDAVRELEKEYETLAKKQEELNNITNTGNKLTDKQIQEQAELTKQLSAVNDELTQSKSIIDQFDPTNLTASFDEVYGSVKPLSTQIGELEDRLYQMRLEGQANSEEFINISERIGTMRAAIIETDREIDILASNKGVVGLRDQFGALGTSLMNLDFNNASRSLQGMQKSLQGIDIADFNKGIISFGKNLGGTLVQGVKLASKAVAQFTKTLLANPMVWLALAVGALVVGLVKLMDSLGLLQPILDAVGAVFEWFGKIIDQTKQALNDFTDWLGITDKAGEKARENEAKRAKEYSEELDKRTSKQNNTYSNELRLLQKRGINTQEDIDREYELTVNILKNEKQKTLAKIDAVKAEMKLMLSKGKLSDEEKDKLKEQSDQLIELRNTINDVNTSIEIAEIDRNDKSTDLNNKTIKEKEQKQKEANDKAKQAQQKADQEAQKMAELQAQALAKIEELSQKSFIDSLEKEYDKELQTTLYSLEKEREEILKNKTLTAEQIATINDYYNKLEDASIKKRDDERQKELDDTAKKTLTEQERIGDLLLAQRLRILEKDKDESLKSANEYENERYKQQKDSIEKERVQALEGLDKNSEEYKKLQEYYFNEELIAFSEHNKAIDEIQKEYDEKALQEQKDKYNSLAQGLADGFNLIGSELGNMASSITSTLLTFTDGLMDILADTGASAQEKGLAIAGAALGMINSILGEISAAQERETERMLSSSQEQTESAMSNLDSQLAQGLITQEQYEQQKYQLELQAFNREEAIKKKAFEQDKKMKVAQATIGMITGMVSAFTGAMQLGPIAGPIVGGILAAAVGVMGAINIAKIKATKYQGGTPPTAPSVPSVAIGDTTRDIEGNDTNQGNVYSQGGNSPQPQQPQPIAITASVSITEIEDTRNKVDKYEKVSEL